MEYRIKTLLYSLVGIVFLLEIIAVPTAAFAANSRDAQSIRELQQVAEEKTGWNIDWDTAGVLDSQDKVRSAVLFNPREYTITRQITNPVTGERFRIECIISYPPLKIACRIDFGEL